VSWSEDRLHRWLARAQRPASLAGSRGHDAAVLRSLEGRLVTCVDQTLEGVHFDRATAPARAGRKAAARALSDLAACAARPRALLLGLCAPPERDEAWLRAAIGGVRALGAEHGAELVGGDLCCAPGPVSLSVSALGELPGRRRPPGRDRARPGQVVVVTGALGGSGLGRHLSIVPRLREGRRLFELGASALMDVSDGLAWDLFRLARASGVCIELERVPLHRDAYRAARADGRAPEWHALHDGEDHELIATLSAAALRRALAAAAGELSGLEPIGRVRAGCGLRLPQQLRGARGRRWSPGEGGWRHGD